MFKCKLLTLSHNLQSTTPITHFKYNDYLNQNSVQILKRYQKIQKQYYNISVDSIDKYTQFLIHYFIRYHILYF